MKFKQVYLTYVASWGQNSVVCQNEKKRRELLLIIQIKKYQFFLDLSFLFFMFANNKDDVLFSFFFSPEIKQESDRRLPEEISKDHF